MLEFILFFCAVIFLIGTFLLAGLISSFRSLQKRESEKTVKSLGFKFFYKPFHSFFFPEYEFESLFFAISSALNINRFFFTIFSAAYLLSTQTFQQILVHSNNIGSQEITLIWAVLLILLVLFISFFLGDYLPRFLGTKYPESLINFCAPLASFYLFASFPISFPFLFVARRSPQSLYFDCIDKSDTQAKQEIIDIIKKSVLTEELDTNEKKLISSVLSFCEHITREVMIPRVDLFSIEATTSIKEAVKLLEEEGFSRVPVYEETIDNIVGILMYKDLLKKYMEYEEKGNDSSIIEAPVSSILKTPLYTPETKKIFDLLQDFRKKQTHIAIVVDEYGGTEGIITIEDILEDIVGEIIDEYDDEEEDLYTSLPDGAWIIDPRMSLLDAEEQLGITIPQIGDYDTIGGYIFHCAGEIPSKGFTILNNDIKIEVLKSNERSIEKIRITPRLP